MTCYSKLRCPASLLFGVAALLLSGCSGEDDFDTPDDVSGNYTLSFSNGANGCEFEDYQEGETAKNIELAINQDGADITGEFEGLVGVYLELVFGSRIMSGTVRGDTLSMKVSSKSVTEGDCKSSLNVTLNATIDGDVLEGDMRYTVITNGDDSCTAVPNCVTIQRFNGTRPPQ